MNLIEKFGIAIIAYNRGNSLKRLLNSLGNADYQNKEVDLIISIDFSENQDVEKIAHYFEWNFGEKKIIRHTKNLGLMKHVLSVGKYTSNYDALIVLEDDLVVSRNFYEYVEQTVKKYKNDSNIAGISLYSFGINPSNRLSFEPEHDGYDVYFLQFAQSWGQVWTYEKWKEFEKWLKNKKEFSSDYPYPLILNEWSKNSWLKFHILYCIENNKYFVYPRISLTTNFSDKGVHNVGNDSTFQRALLNSKNSITYNLPTFLNEGIRYDSFFERSDLKQIVLPSGVLSKYRDIELDLYGIKTKYSGKYVISSRNLNYEILHSFGLQLKPHELNIYKNVPGEKFRLYNLENTKKNKRNHNEIQYYFGVSDYKHAFEIFITLIKEAIKNKLKIK